MCSPINFYIKHLYVKQEFNFNSDYSNLFTIKEFERNFKTIIICECAFRNKI